MLPIPAKETTTLPTATTEGVTVMFITMDHLTPVVTTVAVGAVAVSVLVSNMVAGPEHSSNNIGVHTRHGHGGLLLLTGPSRLVPTRQ